MPTRQLATLHLSSALAGDLFECFEDLDDPELWQATSEQPEQQEQSRIDILRVADYIVPGHGPMFQVPQEFRKQIRVVMLRTEHFLDCGGEGAGLTTVRSQCIIVETD